jgi:hypothetical protein
VVDDIAIFFPTREEAERVLHELTAFVHANHRLVFSGEKTKIMTSERYVRTLRDEEAEEKKLVKSRTEEKAMRAYYDELVEKLAPYDAFPMHLTKTDTSRCSKRFKRTSGTTYSPAFIASCSLLN